VLTVKDLVPIVFSKADKQQQDLVANYLEDQIAKTGLKGREGVTSLEIEALFECYDSDHIGYITVRLLREKVKGLKLPLTAHSTVSQSFADFEDDELINISEFIRVFHTYICAM
jgi:Ca2+-binding EF-hand superfamily protein